MRRVSFQSSTDSSNSQKTCNEAGAVILEFALTIFPFLLLVLGIVEASLAGHTSLSLHSALSRAGRWGSLGLTIGTLSREESIQAVFEQELQSLTVSLDRVNFSVCPARTPDCPSPNAGGSGQFVLLQAQTSRPVLLGLFTDIVSAELLVKNEPF